LLLFAGLARLRGVARRDWPRVAMLSAFAIAVAAVLLAPYLRAYLYVHRADGFGRSVDDTQAFAGSWADYLSTGAPVPYEACSHRFMDHASSPAFPGIVGGLLALLAFVWPESRRDLRLRMCAAGGVGCALVSFAPRAPFYEHVHPLIPMFWAV